MLRRFLPFLILLLAVPLRAETPSQIPNPRAKNHSWIADQANVLTTSDEARINALIDQLEKQTGAEIAVVTVHNLSGQDVESWAHELFNEHWHVGKKGKDNGVLFVAAIDDRKARIEVGYGLEGEITDSRSGAILRSQMQPPFRAGNYAQGVTNVVKALDAQIRGVNFGANAGSNPNSGSRPQSNSNSQPFSPVRPSIPSTAPNFGGASSSPAFYPSNSRPQFPFGLILLGMAAAGGIGGILFLARRPPKCATCEIELSQLSESDELPFLTPEQKFEQNLGAVDWKVWNCPQCGTKRIVPHEAFFSAFRRCVRCGNRTARVETHVLQHPTYYSSGQEEIVETCEWPACRHQTRRLRTIPRLVRTTSSGGGFSSGGGGSSSSSSSSGGSFGGGSSGGGGASSGW